jgi:hypothetical protein
MRPGLLQGFLCPRVEPAFPGWNHHLNSYVGNLISKFVC